MDRRALKFMQKRYFCFVKFFFVFSFLIHISVANCSQALFNIHTYIQTSTHMWIHTWHVAVCVCVSMHSRLLLLITNVVSSSSVFFVCLLWHNTRIKRTNISLRFSSSFTSKFVIITLQRSRVSGLRRVWPSLSLDGQGNNNMLCTHWFCNLLCYCPVVVYVCWFSLPIHNYLLLVLFLVWRTHTHTHSDIIIMIAVLSLARSSFVLWTFTNTAAAYDKWAQIWKHAHVYVHYTCVCSIINVLVLVF